MTRELAIGVVQKPHGVKGYLRIRSFSGEIGHFLGLEEVSLRRGGETALFRVEEAEGAGDTVRVKLAGINDPEAARALVGWEVWVERGRAAPLSDGEYYTADLCGCRVSAPSGVVGTVIAVIDAGAGDLLEIRADDGGSVLVPFRDEFVGEVDVEQGSIRLREDPRRS